MARREIYGRVGELLHRNATNAYIVVEAPPTFWLGQLPACDSTHFFVCLQRTRSSCAYGFRMRTPSVPREVRWGCSRHTGDQHISSSLVPIEKHFQNDGGAFQPLAPVFCNSSLAGKARHNGNQFERLNGFCNVYLKPSCKRA